MSFSSTGQSEGSDQFAFIAPGMPASSPLVRILLGEAGPGHQPSYQTCKDIFALHPLGHKMAQKPVDMALARPRTIGVGGVEGEEKLITEFQRVWTKIQADFYLKSLKTQARVYGIAALAMGDRNHPESVSNELDWERLHETQPYFSVFDPLNTAGSLILDQNPNSPDFQKPVSFRIGGQVYHRSRSLIVMNETPLFIEWSDSAFGFSGRSVYQRALYPLGTFVQSMITDRWVSLKVGLLVQNAKAPGSAQNNRVANFFGFKRQQIKAGITGQVLQIGIDEKLESLNLQNLEGPAALVRGNALKDCAMAASMPAKLLEQEELVEGLAEGTEDAKQIAEYVGSMRTEMTAEFGFFDRVAQHLAWTPAFFEIMKREYPEAYGKVSYKAAFFRWCDKFTAIWPNLLAEPESKQIEVEKVRFESAVAVVEVAAPLIKTPENRAALLDWIADEVNSREKLFKAKLFLDIEEEAAYEPPAPEMTPREGEEVEPAVPAFSART